MLATTPSLPAGCAAVQLLPPWYRPFADRAAPWQAVRSARTARPVAHRVRLSVLARAADRFLALPAFAPFRRLDERPFARRARTPVESTVFARGAGRRAVESESESESAHV